MSDQLSPQEKRVVELLASAWNEFLLLAPEHLDDTDEFRRAIHAAQDKVLARPGRRQLNKVGAR